MSVIKLVDLDLKGKRVFIRADLNVPVKDGKVTSDARITASMATINHCLKQGAKVMVTSHLGRPEEGVWTEENSLKPVADNIADRLNKPVRLIRDWVDGGFDVTDGELVVLENCRINKGEKKNLEDTAQLKYAKLCDVFVMDPFLGRALVYGNYMEEARQVFQRAHSTAQKISPWFQEITIIFTLDSILDSLTPGAGEIADEIRRLQESGARHTQILQARLSLRDNRPDDALEALEKREAYLTGQPAFDTVRIYALRALAFQAKGDEKQALAALQQALELAIPENRVMTFVREGASMESLLRLARVKGITPQFVQHLLAAFESRRKHKPGTPVVTETLVEPLSARELEVLNLLAQGCADKQIAEKLVISRQTVHKHLKNIYEKLDVHSRTEAVARGHQLNVL